MKKTSSKRAVLLSVVLGVSGWMACAPERDPGASPRYLLDAAESFELEVAYEKGAEPYAGTYQGLRVWEIVEENLQSIYEARDRDVTLYVPDELALMRELPSFGKSVWRQEDLYELEESYRLSRATGAEARTFIIFLNGMFGGFDGTPHPNVLAVTLPYSTVIAVFKPVVISAAPSYSELALRWLEQSTLIHELGHVMGLVDNGVPKISPLHEQFSSGALSSEVSERHVGHCENPNCAMYWAHEGMASLMNMAQRARTSGSKSLLGDECLDDLRKF